MRDGIPFGPRTPPRKPGSGCSYRKQQCDMAAVTEIRDFISMKSTELKKFLRERSVPVNDEKHEELAEKAFWANKLGLTVKATDEEAEVEIEKSKSDKLVFDGGIIRLPRPETLTSGWEHGPTSLPETSRDHLDSYIKAGNRRIGLTKTEGTRTFALGKGLYMSGHVRELQYHGISGNVSYCFVRGKVIPQVKTSENPYHTWVVLQKESSQVLTAECTCCVGIQATCKHIAALLFAIIEAVEGGRNASSTSQQQAWGKAPKKGQTLHQPHFAKDIAIVGVRADVSQQNLQNRRVYRSDFDPRVKAHRVVKPISAFNLDWLATITNGKCGLLVHSKPAPDPDYNEQDLSVFKREESVETSFPALTVRQAYQSVKSSSTVTSEAMLKSLHISKHQQEVLAEQTSQQASSSVWADHRKGRITASVAGDCAGSIKNGTVSGHSQIARVMGYYGSPQSAAMSWGKVQEPIARKQYIAHHKLHTKHTGVSCAETGLWISLDCPFVAASPDGIVKCNQCVRGLLEIKNPYTHRLLPIKELAQQKGSFLTTENGVMQLKRTHTYYAQIQIQMWATGFKWCDFVVRTASNVDNLFVERIAFDSEYIDITRPKLECFFVKGIMPELDTGSVHNIVTERAVKKTMDSMLEKLACIVPSTTTDYPCGVCGDVCEDQAEETSENSVCCDNCDRWFHYGCVGISGNEPFLKKRKQSWRCTGCKPSNSKRTRRNRKS